MTYFDAVARGLPRGSRRFGEFDHYNKKPAAWFFFGRRAARTKLVDDRRPGRGAANGTL
jgi:hypothetical protein